MFAVSRLRHVLARFARERRGNAAITFALAALPVIGAVGAAVDYSHANSVKAAMQAALDATALMLAKNAATISNAQLQIDAKNYFKAVFTRPEATGVTVSASYTTNGGSQVVVNGSASVDTNIASIMGIKQITVSGSSTTRWGSSRLRVALVLDNTGSMSDDGKMPALISATNNLLTQLKDAATNDGDVYVSIVPFAKDVNLGAANYKAKWIDWSDWNANNGTCQYYSGWWQPRNKGDCDNAGGTWKKANHKTWNGCVVDRGNSNAPSTGNYDTNIVAPTTSITATLYAAEQYGSCPQAAMGLSYDWSDMTSLVNNMSPSGNTNQAIGLQAGWMSLSGGGPFSVPPMDPNYEYSQVIILLTDGLNTENRWYSKQSSIDAREQMTCDNIKAAGVTLYTIQVNTGGDPTSTLLQNCASSSDKFFLLTSANQIVTTFNAIGTNLSKLYVAK
jgi:Flp pilus assembly protein TadG